MDRSTTLNPTLIFVATIARAPRQCWALYQEPKGSRMVSRTTLSGSMTQPPKHHSYGVSSPNQAKYRTARDPRPGLLFWAGKGGKEPSATKIVYGGYSNATLRQHFDNSSIHGSRFSPRSRPSSTGPSSLSRAASYSSRLSASRASSAMRPVRPFRPLRRVCASPGACRSARGVGLVHRFREDARGARAALLPPPEGAATLRRALLAT